jgi:hypothetical protein
MKRIYLSFAAAVSAALIVLWAVAQLQPARTPDLAGLMPDGALLDIEAKDFSSLLHDWNSSDQKRLWLAGDNYQAFSRSRLFERLSQAQGEFSTAAGLSADGGFLNPVAGKQSCLAIYDIGNLAFVYATRMDEPAVESTPLWQLRSTFQQRTEGAAQFYVRQDQQSGRTAAFASSNGWLILATREDLLAGVLDRLQSPGARSLASEGWFADAVKQAPGPQGDLRMVLNLDKLVRSSYFRSYWVQRNITEMKQYSAALSDFYRTAQSDREERLLLRKPGVSASASGDVSALATLAPPDAAFFSAQASPDPGSILTTLRDNLLEFKPTRVESMWNNAPPAAAPTDTGDASMLDVRIDQAPVAVVHADPYQSLRALLGAAQPTGVLQVYCTSLPQDGVFVQIQSAVVIEAEQNWNDSAVREALVTALQPGLTAGRMGLGWSQRSSASGSYFALDGRAPLLTAVREKQLFIANDAGLIERLLTRKMSTSVAQSGVTYSAVFRHSTREQQNLLAIVTRLDLSGNAVDSEVPVLPQQGRAPAFFSGNIESLSRMFSNMSQVTVEEKDQGAKVTQTVTYQWLP